MIHFALTKSDFVYILVCSSDKEKISGNIRAEWIRQTFILEKNIEVLVLDYQEDILPNTSVSSREVSYLWANKFLEILPKDISLLISSEEYGDFVAEYMQIQAIPYDLKRISWAISATQIRQNIWKEWNSLPNAVKPFFQKKVVILGTESVGKTTLVENLGSYFNFPIVKEKGREIIDNSQNFGIEALTKVVKVQSQAIQNATNLLPPLLIIDTDLHITQSYARFCFGQKIFFSAEDFAIQKADLYLYLKNDVPFVQDGTRLTEENRNLLDFSHQKVLQERGVEFVEISGNWTQRFVKSVQLIERLRMFF